MSGKWEKRGTELLEVVTEVMALRQPIVTELNVRNYSKQRRFSVGGTIPDGEKI